MLDATYFQPLFMSECFGLNGFSDMFADEGSLEAARGEYLILTSGVAENINN